MKIYQTKLLFIKLKISNSKSSANLSSKYIIVLFKASSTNLRIKLCTILFYSILNLKLWKRKKRCCNFVFIPPTHHGTNFIVFWMWFDFTVILPGIPAVFLCLSKVLILLHVPNQEIQCSELYWVKDFIAWLWARRKSIKCLSTESRAFVDTWPQST